MAVQIDNDLHELLEEPHRIISGEEVARIFPKGTNMDEINFFQTEMEAAKLSHKDGTDLYNLEMRNSVRNPSVPGPEPTEAPFRRR